MNRTLYALAGGAALLVVAVLGFGLFNRSGVGTPPSPTTAPTVEATLSASAVPTVAPTVKPTVAASPTASVGPAPDGRMQPGTYFLHPLQAADKAGNALTVTFTVPQGWSTIAGNAIYKADVMIQLEDIISLNGDPCHWSGTADDVSAGTTVDDLVEALVAQTAYEVAEPVGVTIGGYAGKRLDIVHPTEPFTGSGSDEAPECDEGKYRIWSSAIHGPNPIYGQGPANRWQTNILDVNGTRLVVVASDFPETAAADRAELDAVLDSLVIEPTP